MLNFWKPAKFTKFSKSKIWNFSSKTIWCGHDFELNIQFEVEEPSSVEADKRQCWSHGVMNFWKSGHVRSLRITNKNINFEVMQHLFGIGTSNSSKLTILRIFFEHSKTFLTKFFTRNYIATFFNIFTWHPKTFKFISRLYCSDNFFKNLGRTVRMTVNKRPKVPYHGSQNK